MLPDASMMVYPSAGDCATYSAAMLPPAPGLFSTMTFCPRSLDNCCANNLPKISVVPPAAKGIMSLMGFVGQFCAKAKGDARRVNAPAITTIFFPNSLMSCLNMLTFSDANLI